MLFRFLKFLLALLLLPLLAGEVRTLIDLAWRLAPAGSWRETWFISLGAGFVVWLFIFAMLPRAMWLYVLGHEFTHALAAMLAGGKVTAFHVSSKGGHILTDKVNWWIALSPYFIPIYALIWMGLWVTVDFYHSLRSWQPVLYFGIGFFWAFHLTFTAAMAHRRQTDLAGEGIVFSFVIIMLINLFAFLLLLSLLSSGGLWGAAHLLAGRTGQSYHWTGQELEHGWTQARAAWDTRG